MARERLDLQSEENTGLRTQFRQAFRGEANRAFVCGLGFLEQGCRYLNESLKKGFRWCFRRFPGPQSLEHFMRLPPKLMIEKIYGIEIVH